VDLRVDEEAARRKSHAVAWARFSPAVFLGFLRVRRRAPSGSRAGIPAHRRTGHFGWLYGYDSAKIAPGPPVPDFLAPLCNRIAPLLGRAPDEVLVTEYMPGAGIGWHRDAPAFGPVVVGISLLGPCRMRFQRGEAE
jgi:alkylated DNA repair dioxygenase AlkB